MIEMKAIVRNANGIHCRPSGVIYKAVQGYKGEIVLIAKGKEIAVLSVMDIICLGLFCGDSVIIRVTGKNEKKICKILFGLFGKKYDFPPLPKSDLCN